MLRRGIRLAIVRHRAMNDARTAGAIWIPAEVHPDSGSLAHYVQKVWYCHPVRSPVGVDLSTHGDASGAGDRLADKHLHRMFCCLMDLSRDDIEGVTLP